MRNQAVAPREITDILRLIQSSANATGLTDLLNDEDSYPRIKSKPAGKPKANTGYDPAQLRLDMCNRIRTLPEPQKVTLKATLQEKAEAALTGKKKNRRAAFILDLMEMFEDAHSMGASDIEPDDLVDAYQRACKENMAADTSCCDFDAETKISLQKCKDDAIQGDIDSAVAANNPLEFKYHAMTKLDRKRALGAGDEAKVFRARKDEQAFAIKRYFDSKYAKLEREAIELLPAKLRSHIIGFYQSASGKREQPKEQLIMRFAMYDLVSLCASSKFSLRATMMYNLATDLLQLHTSGLAHLDVKPDNILVFKEPHRESYYLKFGDFSMLNKVTGFDFWSFANGTAHYRIQPSSGVRGYPKRFSHEVVSAAPHIEDPREHDIFAFIITLSCVLPDEKLLSFFEFLCKADAWSFMQTDIEAIKTGMSEDGSYNVNFHHLLGRGFYRQHKTDALSMTQAMVESLAEVAQKLEPDAFNSLDSSQSSAIQTQPGASAPCVFAINEQATSNGDGAGQLAKPLLDHDKHHSAAASRLWKFRRTAGNSNAPIVSLWFEGDSIVLDERAKKYIKRGEVRDISCCPCFWGA